MAATVTVHKVIPLTAGEKLFWGSVSFVGDTSYPTGGEALTFAGIERAKVVMAETTGGYAFRFDDAAQKLLVYRTDQVDDPEEEVPNTTDLSALTDIGFIGVGQ